MPEAEPVVFRPAQGGHALLRLRIRPVGCGSPGVAVPERRLAFFGVAAFQLAQMPLGNPQPRRRFLGSDPAGDRFPYYGGTSCSMIRAELIAR